VTSRTEDDDIDNQDNQAENSAAGAVAYNITMAMVTGVDFGRGGNGEQSQPQLDQNGREGSLDHFGGVACRWRSRLGDVGLCFFLSDSFWVMFCSGWMEREEDLKWRGS